MKARLLGILAGLGLLCVAAPAWAQADLTIQSFNCPGGNTVCFRVHANTSTASVTLNGDVIATGGYKVAYTFAHTGSQVVANVSNSDVPIAGSTAAGLSGVLYQRVPTAGSVIGVAIASSAALTSGTAAHAEVTILPSSGSARRTGLTAVIGAGLTNTQYAIATQARGLDLFTSSEAVGCQLNTSTTIAPGTAQLTCTVIIVY